MARRAISGKVEQAWQEVQDRIPGVMLRNRSVTTSSIYVKMPDGKSLRIGDHKGREKYSYRWNLRLDLEDSFWKDDNRDGYTIHRFYTPSVDELVKELNRILGGDFYA